MALSFPAWQDRWGIVLSAGNGERLRDFVYQRRGDHLPKQYNNFIGRRSLLEHTFARAEQLLPAHRLLVVIAREHLNYLEVRRQISSRPPGTLVIQPQNKDTAPGILLPLLHLNKRHREAVVAIFPSDHFILEENVFMRYVERAFRVVESDSRRIVILGMEPHEPDSEYGYIVPGEYFEHGKRGLLKAVELFVEKPAVEIARKIIRAGALWNTLVVVFRLKTLLAVFQRRTPELYRSFQAVAEAIGTSNEAGVIDQVYRDLRPINFSREVLERLPYEHDQSLAVLPVRGVTWNDWGNPDRLLSTLRRLRVTRRGRPFLPAKESTRLFKNGVPPMAKKI